MSNDAEKKAEAPAPAPAPRATQSGLQRVLSRLRGRTQRRIPEVLQMTVIDCGAACLAMVLGYHGRPTRLDEAREILIPSRDGVSARAILAAARSSGLRGRGIKLEVKDLKFLPTASVLYWSFSHFVVFEKYDEKGVSIVDPAF